jgi:hypothetical protein
MQIDDKPLLAQSEGDSSRKVVKANENWSNLKVDETRVTEPILYSCVHRG